MLLRRSLFFVDIKRVHRALYYFPLVAFQALNTSVLEAWTKGFATGHDTKDPVIGKDVVKLLSEAIQRSGLGLECVAVVNDTVSYLKLMFPLATGANSEWSY